ncbi:thiamine pyrophosphate-dependent enzyme [Anaeromyxobacter diazotrophicus]|uniref:Indolepyruvate oxidoreductase subunit IorA n=1 Tax=Anaeromyxobacter diazotrophicus TaxID=2590199 RepID=A0A7I9VSQ6_9BACT|nr:thiamine pyrophosphate-dependent enzyme [Anaeromyxobacter diazotrophicus]GEJ59483.1 indolepyruvate oxidoreductase subunit IorA [Anaeromyxobacter diazotrophicus]
MPDQQLLSGDEAVAHAAFDAGVALGTGYPGTPSTEILEAFSALGGRAQWAPNEKVALEVGLGAAYGAVRALVTMKHVGLNVAADPLFTAAYTGVTGALVVVSADDPGMSSSQNEQDNRRYGIAAGLPVLEPADAQEAYDLFFTAVELSERWKLPVLFRMTTRVCHAKSLVRPRGRRETPRPGHFERDIAGRVMIPSNARPAHRRLRAKLAEIAAWAEEAPLNRVEARDPALGLITDGVAYLHAAEAAPTASVLKLGLVHPLPLEKLRRFAASVERCVVVEEGDPVIADALRAAGIAVESKPEMYRFGELDVARVRRIVARDTSPEPAPPRGKPPELCPACPYHAAYAALKKLDCIVAGDIGCYSLGALQPYQAMDTCVAMGAALGVGLGLRHALPPEQARRVVSVIGDSTFVHSGITGLAEAVYNPPPTGHVVLVLDNGTTAMTGQQEHPGTGRTLDHAPTAQLSIERLAEAMGVPSVTVFDAFADPAGFERLLAERLAAPTLSVIVARRPCILAAADIRKWEKAGAERRAAQACLAQAEE